MRVPPPASAAFARSRRSSSRLYSRAPPSGGGAVSEVGAPLSLAVLGHDGHPSDGRGAQRAHQRFAPSFRGEGVEKRQVSKESLPPACSVRSSYASSRRWSRLREPDVGVAASACASDRRRGLAQDGRRAGLSAASSAADSEPVPAGSRVLRFGRARHALAARSARFAAAASTTAPRRAGSARRARRRGRAARSATRCALGDLALHESAHERER